MVGTHASDMMGKALARRRVFVDSRLMSIPLLYTYRRCPYAMRARMALLQAGVAYQAHEVSLRDKPPAMLAGATARFWVAAWLARTPAT